MIDDDDDFVAKAMQQIKDESKSVEPKAKLGKRVMDFHEEFLEATKITEFNIMDRAMTQPALRAAWQVKLMQEEKYLERMEQAELDLIEQYVAKFGAQGAMKLQTEREARQQEKVVKVANMIKIQKDVVRYLTCAMDEISKMGFTIKNSIEYLKMMQ